MAKKTQPSPELLAANQHLLDLRQQQTCREPELDMLCRQSEESQDWRVLSNLPNHLGWGSAALTAVLRRSQPGLPLQEAQFGGKKVPQSGASESRAPQGLQKLNDDPESKISVGVASVKLYPDIGLAMLRQGQESAGRLWLMCHYLDKQGCGSLRIDITAQNLCTKTSSHYLCGKRQLRNLLQAGEGVYWTRSNERIWLRSAARVAAALGVEWLAGRPVALPMSALLSGIGAFRAHLYAAFHSGRAKGMENGRSAMPIARDTMAGLSGVGRSSQRAYEARLGLRVQPNFAIGEAATEGGQEERAWRQGQALFTLQDYQGRHGRRGKIYLAWQLPNSYTGQHALRPKGRQKRINRQLQDLVMKGMPGNEGDLADRPAAGRPTARRHRPVVAKRYYPNGRAAGQRRPQSSVEPAGPRYWRRQGVGNGRFALWHSLEKA